MQSAISRLSDLARDRDLTLVQLALRWLLAGDIATSVLLGASRPEHLAENLAAASEEPLDAQVLETCDAVWAGLRGVAPAYNR
jgi:aryl-alcohol dehydrogenase (NADP+)